MTDILETEDSAFESIAEDRIDREKGIIRGVKLLGLKSRNKRSYDTKGVRDTAPKALANAQVFFDHPEVANKPRSYRDKFANVGPKIEYRTGEGYFGDIHFNPKHPVAEQFIWDVMNSPKTFGMSINSGVKFGKTNADGDVAVESIELVRSVDIVTKPATTAGIFESEESEDIMDLKTLKEKHPELVKSLLESAGEDNAMEAQLAQAKQEAADMKKRLDAMEAEKAAEKIKSEVTVEIGKAFEGVEIEAGLMKEIVECACEMQEGTRKKFNAVLSKISPMLVDETPEDTETAPAKEAVEEDKPTYRPAAKKAVGYQKGSLLADLGIKKS